METKKVTEQELKEIIELKDKFTSAYTSVGVLETRIKELQIEKDKQFEVLSNLQSQEQALFQRLQTVYGEGVVDLITGEFKPQN